MQSCDLAPLKFSAAGGGKRRCAFACTTIESIDFRFRYQEQHHRTVGDISSSNMAGKGIGCLSEALGALRISAPKVYLLRAEIFAMG